jgi:hypothetical protein
MNIIEYKNVPISVCTTLMGVPLVEQGWMFIILPMLV